MKKTVACLAALILLMTGTALADLKIGDEGNKVRELQRQLYTLGYLDGAADGSYGARTEAAVKWLQRSRGMTESGVFDEETEAALADLWYAAEGFDLDSGLDEEELKELYPHSCGWFGENEWGAVYCYRHLPEKLLNGLLDEPGLPEKTECLLLLRVNELWEKDIRTLFDAWEDALSEPEKAAVREERVRFESTLAESLENWKVRFGDGSLDMLRAEWNWIEAFGITLCGTLNGTQAQ